MHLYDKTPDSLLNVILIFSFSFIHLGLQYPLLEMVCLSVLGDHLHFARSAVTQQALFKVERWSRQFLLAGG